MQPLSCESPSTFIERVEGKAVREARLGANVDLAMFTWQENVRVMVVNTRTLSRDTADHALEKAVQYAGIAGERDKTRMVCAILHKEHYDLGVLHTAQGVQAVFQVGAEWDNAIRLILRFIKAKLPLEGRAQSLLCPRWIERKKESETKMCINLGGARTRSTRAQVITPEQGGGTLTRGKAKESKACSVSCGSTGQDNHTHTKQHNSHT
jgi:hypothetical protein